MHFVWRTHSLRPHLAAALLLSGNLMFSGCKKADTSAAADAAEPVAVQAAHPTVGPIAEEIAADAILAPLAQAALAPRLSAPIRAEYVQRGAHVRKGQLLVTLQDSDLVGNAQDSKGAVTQAQAAYTTAVHATIPEEVQRAELDVAQAKANLDVASRTAEERQRLLREGAIAGRDTDTAIAAAVQAQATYDAAVKHLSSVQTTLRTTNAETVQGQLTSAQGRLLSAEAQVSYASLRSPINGVVTERPFFPGETPAAGTPVITVMDTTSLLAKLHVAQATAQQLKQGGTAELHIPGVPAAQPGTVSFISPALDPGSTTVEIWLKLANADGRYKVGSPVHAVIHGRTTQNAVQVPTSAILPAEDGSTAVLVVSPDSTVHKQAVKVGLRTSDSAQILSGVTPEDTVVTNGGYGVDDGSKVKIGAADAPDPTDKAAPDESKPPGTAKGSVANKPAAGGTK